MIFTHTTLSQTLESLELLGPMGRHDLIVQLALETGGYFKAPDPGNGWDSQQYEIKVAGIYATGGAEVEAIRNWTRAARAEATAMIEVERAQAIIDAADETTDHRTLKLACQTIVYAGRTPYQIGRARQVLTRLDAVPDRTHDTASDTSVPA